MQTHTYTTTTSELNTLDVMYIRKTFKDRFDNVADKVYDIKNIFLSPDPLICFMASKIHRSELITNADEELNKWLHVGSKNYIHTSIENFKSWIYTTDITYLSSELEKVPKLFFTPWQRLYIYFLSFS